MTKLHYVRPHLEVPMSIDPTSQLSQPTRFANGKRVAFALVCWLLSSIGILMSLMMVVGTAIASLLTKPLAENLQTGMFYLGFGTAYAWLALGVMTGGWVGNKQVAWHWPVVGGSIGLVCSVSFVAAIPLYLPCVLLSLYLCYFHLAGPTAGSKNAA